MKRPGQARNTLEETDDFLRKELESAGYPVVSTTHGAQRFRCDRTRPLHHWYSTPNPGDPFFDITNLEVTRAGREKPAAIIQVWLGGARAAHLASQRPRGEPTCTIAHPGGSRLPIPMSIASVMLVSAGGSPDRDEKVLEAWQAEG